MGSSLVGAFGFVWSHQQEGPKLNFNIQKEASLSAAPHFLCDPRCTVHASSPLKKTGARAEVTQTCGVPFFWLPAATGVCPG